MPKKDSIWLGLAIGIVLPGLLYCILYLISLLIETHSYFSRPFQGNKMLLISLVINLVTIRIYFVNLKMDRTGRGIILATFLIGMAFFLVFKGI
jgi:hypothetical protein